MATAGPVAKYGQTAKFSNKKARHQNSTGQQRQRFVSPDKEQSTLQARKRVESTRVVDCAAALRVDATVGGNESRHRCRFQKTHGPGPLARQSQLSVRSDGCGQPLLPPLQLYGDFFCLAFFVQFKIQLDYLIIGSSFVEPAPSSPSIVKFECCDDYFVWPIVGLWEYLLFGDRFYLAPTE